MTIVAGAAAALAAAALLVSAPASADVILPAPALRLYPALGAEPWMAALSPPWEVVDLAALVYVAEPPGANVIQRPWATAARGGDCEDWAIAEYHLRRARGETGLAIVIGWEPLAGTEHAVLLAGGQLIDRLDVLSPLFEPRAVVSEAGGWAAVAVRR